MLVLSQDQHILMESARGAIGASSPVSAFRKLRSDAAGEGFSRAFWRECAELGWTGVLVPEDYGGIDFGVVGAGVIARELARRLAPSPFLSTSVLAASALSRFGSDALRSEWLPRIARGMVVVGVSGDSAPPTVRSTRHGEGWSLAGLQPLVLDGHVAHAWREGRSRALSRARRRVGRDA
jgi:alkylation response protein AidB-like acyl-CoA dehydrogenase